MSLHKPFITVGKSERRKDGRDKLTGKALYPQDMCLDNMVFGATVRSTEPHAKFTLDLESALACEGVLKILTAKDVLGHNHHGVLFKDHEVICKEKVRRVGDPVAFVVAETEEQALYAAGQVKVHYELLTPVLDPEIALQEDAPRVHDNHSNLVYHYKCRRGDLKNVYENAAVVVERVYDTPFVDHAFLQPESGLAYKEEDGTVVVLASTQYPHFDRMEVAEAIGYEEGKVLIINPIVGGAFGGREDLSMQAHLALATIYTGRPVKMTMPREESFYAHSKRHPIKIKMKSAADAEGKLLACEAEIIGDTGAYASWAINVLRKAGVHVTGPYEVPNVHVDSRSVYTNNPFAGAMRGFGATQVPVAYEQQMDLIGEALGLSPYEIRKRNIFRKGSITANGQVLVESVPLECCLDTLQEAMTAEPMAMSPSPDVKVGRGIAVSWYGTGYGNGYPDVSVATIELCKNGDINLRVGATEVGQGSKTIMPQLCAEALSMTPENIHILCENTNDFEDSGTAAASRQTYNTGNAVKVATESFKKALLEEARLLLKLNSAAGLVVEHQEVHLPMLPSKRIHFSEVAKALEAEGRTLMVTESFTAQTVGMDSETGEGAPYWPYTFNAYGVEVEVQIKTGRVQVTKAWCAQDVGRAINPALVEGQIDGGFVMGLGYTLYEDLGVKGGHIQNNKFAKYILPTAMDIPVINKYIIEDPENTAPYGAKGIGEPVMVPVAPAILNAIADATGVRIYDLPATPDRVLKALVAHRNQNVL